MLLVIFLPGFTKYQDLKERNRALEKRIKELQDKNLALQEEQERLQTDESYLESAVRQKLGVVKKGEVVYRLVPETEE